MRASPLAPILFAALCAAPGCRDRGVDTASVCVGAPVVNWDNFGEGFVVENCQPCHATDAAERYGAPESIVFDTLEQTWDLQDRVLARSTGDDADMPPAGGVSEEDRLKLEWWLLCAEEGT